MGARELACHSKRPLGRPTKPQLFRYARERDRDPTNVPTAPNSHPLVQDLLDFHGVSRAGTLASP